MKSHFHTYNSIDNPNNSVTIRQIYDAGYTNANIEWVALEKIHGANFSFITDGNIVETAKRSSLISDTEQFFKQEIVKDKYRDDILLIFNKIKQENEHTISIQVFGELFGGHYPGIKSNFKHVQKGVWYNPQIDFMVFDIRVNTLMEIDATTKPKKYLSYYCSQNDLERYFQGLNILKNIPVMHKGSFDELMKLNPDFTTLIPNIYNLPPLPDNKAEGYVIKANIVVQCGADRPIIKIKNNKFLEKTPSNNSTNSNNDVRQNIVDEMTTYCTQNRFNCLISKYGTELDTKKLQNLYVADVITDYTKNNADNENVRFATSCFKRLSNYLTNNNLITEWYKEYESNEV